MKQRRYVAYLIRLWLSDNAGEPAWRGSLEDPHTGKLRRQPGRISPWCSTVENPLCGSAYLLGDERN